MLENVSRTCDPFQTETRYSKTNNVLNKSKAFFIGRNKNTNIQPCPLYKSNHPLFRCIAFQNMNVYNRKDFVQKIVY